MKIRALEKKEEAIEGGMANKSFEEEDVPRGNKLKRSAPLDVEIDSDKPRKIMRLTKTTPATSEYKGTDQKKSHNTSADQALAVALPSNTVSSRTADARSMPHWSTNFGDCPGFAKSLAIYSFIKFSGCVQSFERVLQQATLKISEARKAWPTTHDPIRGQRAALCQRAGCFPGGFLSATEPRFSGQFGGAMLPHCDLVHRPSRRAQASGVAASRNGRGHR